MPSLLDAFDALDAELGVLGCYEDGVRNVLAVEAHAGDGGACDVLAAFAHYHRHLNPKSRLFLVNGRYPKGAVEQAGVTDAVVRADRVGAPRLKAYYLLAHAFLWADRDECFAAPLAVAMHCRIPCVVWGSSALAGLLGDEALAWPGADPALVAESLHECIEDEGAGDWLVERQRQRCARLLARPAVRGQLCASLGRLVGQAFQPDTQASGWKA
jgi:hypothetical protein